MDDSPEDAQQRVSFKPVRARGSSIMDVMNPICAGMDVHKKEIKSV
jgi:hypothetical protein